MNRATYLPHHALYLLKMQLHPVDLIFPNRTYLVGSCLENIGYRDVDVRTIISTGDYENIPPAIRQLLCNSLSVMLSDKTGLPVDYQIQTQDEADSHNGARIPLSFYNE